MTQPQRIPKLSGVKRVVNELQAVMSANQAAVLARCIQSVRAIPS